MTTGVVVMSYGTPDSSAEIGAFYTDVRRGHPPTDEQLAELAARYEAIGGLSPLTTLSSRQVAGIRRALGNLAPGRFRTEYGTKHAQPKIEAAVDTLAAAGVEDLVGVVLAPHYSALSIGEYVERLHQRANEVGIARTRAVERFGTDATLIELLSVRVKQALCAVGTPADQTEVLFSAHSLPARILEMGDPYPAELQETADLVADSIGLTRYRSAWQSASRTPEPWLGPDIGEVLEELAAGGTTGVVVCPAGFTSDHLEVLYDLDLVARARAEQLGLSFARTPSLNDDPELMAALARSVLAAATGDD